MFGVHNLFEELERHLREPAAAERGERVRRSDS